MRFSIKRLAPLLTQGGINLHSSQYGEDIYLHKRFRRYERPGFYVDIGAHHPFKLSNTVYLWALGWNGVNVDAGTEAVEAFRKHRPNDINIHAAVVDSRTASSRSTIDFYYNREIDNCATCDPAIARERGLNHKATVPCVSLNEIITKATQHFEGEFDLLNIDIEGLDEAVISDMNSWEKKPNVLMIEIYGKNIRDVMQRPAFTTIENSGYAFVERIGHTAIFELQR